MFGKLALVDHDTHALFVLVSQILKPLSLYIVILDLLSTISVQSLGLSLEKDCSLSLLVFIGVVFALPHCIGTTVLSRPLTYFCGHLLDINKIRFLYLSYLLASSTSTIVSCNIKIEGLDFSTTFLYIYILFIKDRTSTFFVGSTPESVRSTCASTAYESIGSNAAT